MEKKVISFLGGLNKDDNGLNFPEGDYKSANNIIIESDEEGNGVAIKKMNSTKQLSSNIATHLQSSEYVQSCVDLDNSIYVLLKGRYYPGGSLSSSFDVASIVKITIVNGIAVIAIVINNYDYQGCTIEPDMCIVGDRLVWNFMGDGIPMMIQTSLYNETPTPQELTLIKAPPIYQLKVTEISGDSLNIFTDNQYQFAARYVYNDSEVSVLGPISPLSSGVEFVEKIQLDLNESEVHPIKAKSVEYYVRDGNNGVWFLIDNAKLNSPTVITFSGIKSLALPTLVSSKQFDSVPFATKNVESVNNLIFLGNNLETLPLGGGETTIDTTDVDMSIFDASITSVAITTRKTIILILDGIILRINETTTLATESTTRTDNAITTAGLSWTVIAKAEQIPSTCTVIGLLSSSGSLNNILFFLDKNESLLIIYCIIVSLNVNSVSDLDIFRSFCISDFTLEKYGKYIVKRSYSMSDTPSEVIVPPDIPSTPCISPFGAPPFMTFIEINSPSSKIVLPVKGSSKNGRFISAPRPGVSPL